LASEAWFVVGAGEPHRIVTVIQTTPWKRHWIQPDHS